MLPRKLLTFTSALLTLFLLIRFAPRSDAQQQASVDKAQTENASENACVGVNAQRTRVFDSPAVLSAGSLVWKTGILFESYSTRTDVATLVGMGRNNTSAVIKEPSGHSFTDLMFARDALYFGIYINDGYLISQDAKTGKDRWRFKLKGVSVSSPAVAGGAAYIGASDNAMYAVDVATGLERWRFKPGSKKVIPFAPVVDGGLVFFGASEEGGTYGSLLDGRIYALDCQTGKQVWTFKTDAILDFPAISHKTLFVTDSNGDLRALESETGKERWKLKFKKALGPPAIMNDTVYFHDHEGTLYAVDKQSGQTKWKTAKAFKAGSALAIGNDLICYSAEGNSVYAVDPANGSPKWKFPIRGQCLSPVMAGGLVYFSCRDGFIYAVDAATGTQRWKLESKGTFSTSPAIANGVMYFLNADGHMYAVR